MSIRILLADNHQMYRDAIGTMLRRQPDLQVVAVVGDGVAALEAVLEHQPDVALMDVGMPEMDGIDATRAITARAPSVKVVGLSLHSEPGFVRAMLEAGARGYVLKEDPFDQLLQAIHEVAAGRTYLSPNLPARDNPDAEAS